MLEVKPIYVKKPWGALKNENESFNINDNEKVGEIILYSPDMMDCENNKMLPDIMLKFIFSKEWLSIQVHPNDEQAQKLENYKNGKNEAWYFMSSGDVISGIKKNINDLSLFCDLDNYVIKHVEQDQIMHIPAGTVHAIGPNISLFEIQQNCDITYRLYDWDMTRNRELHIDKGHKVITNHISEPLYDNCIINDNFRADIMIFDDDIYINKNNEKAYVIISLSDMTKNAIVLFPNEEIKLKGKYAICSN